jgi:hypothetical protein
MCDPPNYHVVCSAGHQVRSLDLHEREDVRVALRVHRHGDREDRYARQDRAQNQRERT